MRPSFTRPACRSCWPATTMSCRRTRTSIRPNPTRTTRWCSPSRASQFQRLLDQGWTDAIRTLHREPMYTFWDYLRNRWPRDAGLSLDHLLLSPEAAKLLAASGVDRDVRGKAGASDHAPAWIILKDRTKVPRKSPPAVKATTKAPKKDEAAREPAAARHRRRQLHASLLSRAAEDDPGARRQAGGRHRRLREFPAAALSRGEAARRARRRGTRWRAETYRHAAFADYQSGREFDDALVDQLDALPEFVAAFGFCERKGARLRGRRFPRRCRRCGRKARRHGAHRERRPRHVPARLGPHHDPLSAARGRDGAHHAQRSARALRRRSRAGARFHRAPRRSVGQASGRRGHRSEDRGHGAAANTEASRPRSRRAASRTRPRTCASTARSRRWT